MAIVVFDGFDGYSGIASLFSRAGALQWTEIGGFDAPIIDFVPGRSGFGQALAVQGGGLGASDGNQTIGCSFDVDLSTGFIGIAVLSAADAQLPSYDLMLVDYANNVTQVTVRFGLLPGVVTVYAGDRDTTAEPTILGRSGTNAFSPYIWNYVELGATIGATGSVEVRINGNSVVSISGATVYPAPLPAGATASSVFNGLRVRVNTQGAQNPTGTTALSLDDLYICSGDAGPGTYPCKTFVGDVAVRTLRPTGNASVQWTPLAQTNWQMLSEAQLDGDTSYNAATAVGAQDLFTFQPLPTTVSTVFGVQVTGAHRKQDASAQAITQNIVSGGTAAASAPYTLSLSYSYSTSLFVLDPHTNATWTPASVDLLIAGFTLNS